MAIARQGWVELQSSPIWGIGTGHFRYNEGPPGTRQFVHNLVGEVLIETGVVGLMIFSTYFIAGWRGLRRSAENRYEQKLLRHGAEGLFVFAVVCAMVSGDLTTNYLVWVSQALLVVTFSGQGVSGPPQSRR
jgi:O-antigen ligase